MAQYGDQFRGTGEYNPDRQTGTRQTNEYGNPVGQTDEYGNRVDQIGTMGDYGGTGMTGSYGIGTAAGGEPLQNTTAPVTTTGQETTTTALPGSGYGYGAEQQGGYGAEQRHHEKKGVIEKIKEKLPGHH